MSNVDSEKPLITITVAIYNAESYLEKCINSILSQTYNNWELILVNDGSTDNSKKVCEKYEKEDNRIVLINKNNGGLSSARQLGLDSTHGVYVCFIDPDDYLHRDYLKLLYEKISKTQADICVCGFKFVDRGSTNIIKVSSEANEVVKVDERNLANRYFSLSGTYFMSDSWNKLYRTQFIKETGVRFELPPKLNGSDLAFNHKLILHCPVMTYVKEALYYHVIVDNSAVHRKNRKLLNSYMIIMRQLLNEAERINANGYLGNELSKMFVRFMRDGLYDSFLDKRKISERCSCIRKAYEIIKHMKEQYPVLNFRVKIQESMTLDLFRLSMSNQAMLYLYLSIYTAMKG